MSYMLKYRESAKANIYLKSELPIIKAFGAMQDVTFGGMEDWDEEYI